MSFCAFVAFALSLVFTLINFLFVSSISPNLQKPLWYYLQTFRLTGVRHISNFFEVWMFQIFLIFLNIYYSMMFESKVSFLTWALCQPCAPEEKLLGMILPMVTNQREWPSRHHHLVPWRLMVAPALSGFMGDNVNTRLGQNNIWRQTDWTKIIFLLSFHLLLSLWFHPKGKICWSPALFAHL